MYRSIFALAALAGLSLSSVACLEPTADAEPAATAETTSQDVVSRSASFETFQGLDGRHYFNLVAGNGQNVLRSQGYTSLASAEKGIASVLANGTETDQFTVLSAADGRWYFTLDAANGETIGVSQLYASRSNAERGARTVRALVTLAKAGVTAAAPARERFEVFTGEDGKTYFHLRAGNGEILLSSQGYVAEDGASAGIASVQDFGVSAARFHVAEAFSGGWTITLVAANNEVIAQGELYASESNAKRAVTRLTEILGRKLPVSLPE